MCVFSVHQKTGWGRGCHITVSCPHFHDLRLASDNREARVLAQQGKGGVQCEFPALTPGKGRAGRRGAALQSWVPGGPIKKLDFLSDVVIVGRNAVPGCRKAEPGFRTGEKIELVPGPRF